MFRTSSAFDAWCYNAASGMCNATSLVRDILDKAHQRSHDLEDPFRTGLSCL
ncbi:hypothetical protein M404DRAFT_1003116 [Pisolithus tinctorius Marx 270]|uniref:Uncharacterized protein n=1 Tax=Pisolithus tinctorius Marx 270 TaxID=870435 RepID=A0A0C3NKG1_PISTI|nr:hypothetical protein M404DRAFT_1003116 [Pisolithus tinctorius Marx 270]